MEEKFHTEARGHGGKTPLTRGRGGIKVGEREGDMTLEEYWNGLLYEMDGYLKKGNPRGDEKFALEIYQKRAMILGGRCPLCFPPAGPGKESKVFLPPGISKADRKKTELLKQGFTLLIGDLDSYYLWPASTMFFKSCRGEPGAPGMGAWPGCDRNHYRGSLVFLDFQGRKPPFERLKDLGFPYLNPEVPFLIPYLMKPRYTEMIESYDGKKKLIPYPMGGTVSMVQGFLPDPWEGFPVKYTIVSTYAQVGDLAEMGNALHPVWDHIPREGIADVYDIDLMPVHGYKNPFTGEPIPLEAWYDWKPWVEAGLVSWWEETKPGVYTERSRDWESFPLKNQTGRRRMLYLKELRRNDTNRDTFGLPRFLDSWDEVMDQYNRQDFDTFDEKKIKEQFESVGNSIF